MALVRPSPGSSLVVAALFAFAPGANVQVSGKRFRGANASSSITTNTTTSTSGGGVTPLTDDNIYDAVKAWCNDSDSAAVVYGNISAWDTSEVTDMSWLFAAPYDDDWYIDDDDPSNKGGHCSSYATFNEDLSK